VKGIVNVIPLGIVRTAPFCIITSAGVIELLESTQLDEIVQVPDIGGIHIVADVVFDNADTPMLFVAMIS
jgi:hypothetical protein